MDDSGDLGRANLGILMLFKAAFAVPVWEYAMLLLVLVVLFLYCALECHLLEDLRNGFRGHHIQLHYNLASKVASNILPKCELLKRRYLPTQWICSPHLQTAFLHFFGRPPQVEYYRQLCHTPDGGTIALDWLNPDDWVNSGKPVSTSMSETANKTPTVVIIPGLTSDSADGYVKHIAHSLARKGWRVVVANHRGLGGVSITSNQFYNAGWTEDLRGIFNHLHQAYPESPLLAVGTSIGANILVKYLGEEGENTPVGGAAAICCPWDLVVCDRFISRRGIQRFYDKILAFSLRSYAKLHQITLSRIADWDLINESRSIRDFDKYCTRVVGRYENVDTYYRKCSSAYYLDSVSIPLFCISALDDPVCTKEAIPWDECRANANVVLGVTRHGGHLAFFEGLSATSIWWVRATTEFLDILHTSSLLHRQKKVPVSISGPSPMLTFEIDKSPYLSVSQNGVISREQVFTESSRKSGKLMSDEGEPKEMAPINAQEESHAGRKPFTESLLDLTPGNEGEYDCPISREGINAIEKQKCRSSKMQADTDSQASSSTGSDTVKQPCHYAFKLSVYNHSELLILESALSQFLRQVETLKFISQKESYVPNIAVTTQENVQNDSTFVDWPSLPVDVHPDSPLSSTQGKLDVVDTNKTEEAKLGRPAKDSTRDSLPFRRTAENLNSDDDDVNYGVPIFKGIKKIAAQNRHTLWLLAYVAIVTTWPLVGSALFLRGQRQLKGLLTKHQPK